MNPKTSPSAWFGQWRQPPQVQGHAAKPFLALRRDFARLQPVQPMGGAALAVYWRGVCVLDVWTGWQNPQQPWQADTLSMSYSTGKGVLATLAHRLVDQGVLAYDQPMAHWWPAFAAHGKATITLRQLLSHQTGLHGVRGMTHSAAQLLDWPLMLTLLEQATPAFAPGTAVAYQALTFGHLLGGLIEKATGESLAAVFARELTAPLGIDREAFFGTPPDQLARVAVPFGPFDPPKRQPQPPQPAGVTLASQSARPPSLAERVLRWSGQDLGEVEAALRPKGMGRINWFGSRALQACMPSMNGVFTARALARHYAMLAGGGELEGNRLLSPTTFAALSSIQTRQRDRVMPVPMHWRLGYHRVLALGAPQGFGHVGYNGSGAWCDPSRGLAFAYLQTHPSAGLAGDPRLWWLSQRALWLADRAR